MLSQKTASEAPESDELNRWMSYELDSPTGHMEMHDATAKSAPRKQEQRSVAGRKRPKTAVSCTFLVVFDDEDHRVGEEDEADRPKAGVDLVEEEEEDDDEDGALGC